MIQKSLGSTSVNRHNYNKACVQACLVNSYFYQQHENHLSTRPEQCCFQVCRRHVCRSGYLYKVSILWSNYGHWENLVIRNEWVFFVCKQIAFWFIRDAPLRTNCSRCGLCSQWLKGPTWISYERVTIAFNPALYWTGMLLAGAAARPAEHRGWGLLINYTTFSWRSPHRGWLQKEVQLLPPCTRLAKFWAAAVPHSPRHHQDESSSIRNCGFALQHLPTGFSSKNSDGNRLQWWQKSLLQVSR